MISPTPAPGAPEQFDTGPLSWVMAEIREALEQSVRSMNDALAHAGDAQTAPLKTARMFLHQAHGALQMVEIDGVTAITRVAEDILNRMIEGTHMVVPADVEDLAAAYRALTEYLQELLAGAAHRPVRLYPYYKALLVLQGAERIHPSELFFPRMATRTEPALRLALPPAAKANDIDLATLRQRYEKALLPFLKSVDAAAGQEHATAMRAVLAELEESQTDAAGLEFWRVMHGFAALLSDNELGHDLAGDKHVKQLFARINMQLRKLAKPPFVIDEVLLRDALFFIALAEHPSALTLQLRRGHALETLLPSDYERKRYGQVDSQVLAEARRHLAEAKSGWSRISAGDEYAVEGFEQAMAALAEAGPALKSASLAKLLRELASIARRAAVANAGEGLGLEMAGGLLFVENALNHTSRLAEDFAQRAEVLNTRLQALVAGERAPATVQWLDDMSRAVHERETMFALTGQMKTNLAHVEKVLDAYFGNTSKSGDLPAVDPALQQIEGILAVLDQGEAAKAVRHTRSAIAKFSQAGLAQEQASDLPAAGADEESEIIASVAIEADDWDSETDADNAPTPAQKNAFRQVAQNIGALSFFIETLQNNASAARGRFSFDEASGVFHANLIGQIAAPAEGADVEEQVEGGGLAAKPETSSLQAPAQERPALDMARFGNGAGAYPDLPYLAPDFDATATTPGSARKSDTPADSDGDGKTAGEMAERFDGVAAADADAADAAAAQSPAIPSVPQSDAAVDAELLEIFLGEATEVLAFVAHTLPLLKQAPFSLEHMTAIRRSFHTLKGSGRMVGLMAFGEAAWSMERVLNLQLADNRPGYDGLYGLIDLAVQELGAWVTELQTQGESGREASTLVAAAERLLAGEAVDDVPATTATTTPAAKPPADEAADETVDETIAPAGDDAASPPAVAQLADTAGTEVPTGALADAASDVLADGNIVSDPEPEQLADAVGRDDEAVVAEAADAADAADHAVETLARPDAAPESAGTGTGTVIGFPDRQTAEQPRDDTIKRVGTLEISVPLYNIYLAETDELVRLLANDLAEWRHEPDRRVNVDAVNAAHSLTGSSATVGFTALQELAHAHELLLLTLARLPDPLRPFEFDAVATAIECMKRMLGQFALGELAAPEVRQVQALQELKSRILARAVPLAREDEEHGEDDSEEDIEAFAIPGERSEDDLDGDIDLDIDFDVGNGFAQQDSAQALPSEAEIAASLDISDISDASLKALASDLEHNETLASSESPLAVQSMGQDEAPLPDLDLDLDAEMPPETEPETAPETEIDQADQTDAPQITEEQAIEAAAAAGMYQEDSVFAGGGLPEHGPGLAADNDDSLAAVSALMAAAVEIEAAAGSELASELAATPAMEGVEGVAASTVRPTNTAPEAGVAAEKIDEVSIRPVVLPEHLTRAGETLYEHERAHIAGVPLSQPRDELDTDLLPVFIEEANDILPEMGRNLRQLQQAPEDRESVASLLRLLHTIKGSARMAGAMVLGQHLHEMESRIEQVTLHGAPSVASVEELLGRLDMALALFERLGNPATAASTAAPFAPSATHAAIGIAQPLQAAASDAAATPAVEKTAAATAAAGASVATLPARVPGVAPATAPTIAPAAPAPPVPLVRVRADLLDRLVNQAGEVSISRSRVESDVAVMKSTLTELGDNVLRLQSQLREIEIQAETQMASQKLHASEREFDPLEFDRFTRLQELTRIIAESVNDVASVQQNLSRTVDDTSQNLVQQARFTRDLQQDLMRVRMVQFASISERLYRITRQASKELDKRVNLDIRGGSVEIDRSVLEKMTGPFEHLLRNSIVHGIESRAERNAAGKKETGELLVEVRQAGNEVVIHVSDDGRGLDLARIAEKARATGLLAIDSEPSEAEVRDMIFHPGFSTAREITELAGRGIGMDVVRAEAVSLGGRVSIDSEPGRGAQFTIHLPLTLAVTQVVVLATGGKTYAVPSVLVEQVQQLKSSALANAYNDGGISWLGQRVPLHYLSTLLGDTVTAPLAQQYSPLLILKSGTGRVAIHVDAVLGNREVVIKNIGPQLSRMPGVAGATVLGAGDIVLILDPVPLAQRHASDPARSTRPPGSMEGMEDQGSAWAHHTASNAAPGSFVEMGAVAELSASADDVPDYAAGNDASGPAQETLTAHGMQSSGPTELDGQPGAKSLSVSKTTAAEATGQAAGMPALATPVEQQDTGSSRPAGKRNGRTMEPETGKDLAPKTKAASRVRTEKMPEPPAPTPVQGLRTQRTVMVVDDSLTVRRVTQRMLVREGYQVVLAKDGVDALEQLQAITPDVMLVDIEMPRMDGFDLTRNVRGDERTRAIPIIMITSRTAVKHRTYAMELGVNEYLGKPYQETELLGLVAGFMRKEAAAN